MVVQKQKCHICNDEIKRKPGPLCCVCGKPMCPRCCFNRIYKRQTYYICNRCKDKFDVTKLKSPTAPMKPSERSIRVPRKK